MQTLYDFPFFSLEFNKEGHPVHPPQATELLAYLKQASLPTDLLVLSHGWNNDMEEANTRYDCLLKHLRSYVPVGRRFVAVGLFWPSKKFADKELIPGGAASLGNSAVAEEQLLADLRELHGTFDAPNADAKLDQALGLVPLLESKKDARTAFAGLMKELLAGVHAPEAGDHDGVATIQQASSAGLVKKLGEPLPLQEVSAQPGTSGVAAGLGGFFGGIQEGARNLLNYTTYYQMKERAGLVGRKGLRPVLVQVARQFPQLKLHLAGHSFGGRLVTSAVSGQTDFRIHTMTLLQTAFSHYGFSADYDGQGSAGLFRPIITDGTLVGPGLITHAKADFAISRMYALASRLAGQVGAFIGGPNDKFGGLGSNGAQKTSEADFGALLPATSNYAFKAGRLHNLHGNTILHGKAIISSHGDICGPEIASAIMQAVATT